MNDIELLSPAGSFETALSAFAAGADAVYLGLDAFSARADAVNFSTDQLRDLIAYARVHGEKKVYVTFNTLLDDAQIPEAIEKLAILDELGPDGLIVQDLGVARLVRRHFPSLALHASTQLVAHNLEGVLALRELGFTRVVLARELALEEIRSIAQRCGCEIEVFVHGALCYSLSGLCLFSAMEKNRSGNRGKCAYCCRLAYTDATGGKSLPFSMRDLRLDDSLDTLKEAGVASLKIEGRMKSALYVATVTKHYRELLDNVPVTATRADLETVFSRRTTPLYIHGAPPPAREGQSPNTAESVIDANSLGHLGTPIGTVKRITKDREGRAWLRFHTSRALERHDGLQFLAEGDKPFGFGISDMRVALSRTTAFAVKAGSDVEVLVADDAPIRPGATVFCSASNEVKRRFPVPSFRPSEVAIGTPVDITVTLTANALIATAALAGAPSATRAATLTPAQHPERTADAVRKAFARLGDTTWTLGHLTLVDPDHLFVPASLLNDLRRALVAELDAARTAIRAAQIASAGVDEAVPAAAADVPVETLKMRLDQTLPDNVCGFDELILAIGHRTGAEVETRLAAIAAELRARAEETGDPAPAFRLALPVFTHEQDFNVLRACVKHLVKAGITAWEAADLAGLRLLRQLGLADLTADWTLYGFNRAARAQLAALGVTRCVASPENTPENLRWLAAQTTAPALEFLDTQTTPLFISLTRPAADDPSRLTGVRGDAFASYPVDGLWVTARPAPRRFPHAAPEGTYRTDLSWDAPCASAENSPHPRNPEGDLP